MLERSSPVGRGVGNEFDVSVVLPNRNHGRFLAESLRSLFGQSRPPSEILVVDDASTDDSLAVIDAVSHEWPGRLRLLQNANQLGVVATFNRGLAEVSTPYVTGIGADDRVMREWLQDSIAALQAYPKAGLCSSLSRLIGIDGSDLGPIFSGTVLDQPGYLTPSEVLARLRRDGYWIQGNTVVWRREALVEAGGLREDLGPYCDSFLDHVVALQHGACFVPKYLACWRRMESGFSATMARDPEGTRRMYLITRELMRTTYADVFPADYIALWSRRVGLMT